MENDTRRVAYYQQHGNTSTECGSLQCSWYSHNEQQRRRENVRFEYQLIGYPEAVLPHVVPLMNILQSHFTYMEWLNDMPKNSRRSHGRWKHSETNVWRGRIEWNTATRFDERDILT